MKKSKNIYTANFPELILKQEDLLQLQSTLKDMLTDIDKIARDNNLHCMLTYGTLIGAIRHKGFIPWDDDIDLMMLRTECDKLIDIIKKDYSDKYIVESPDKDKTINKMIKIYLKGTNYVEINKEGWNQQKSIFIDIFPIENLPVKHKIRKWLYFICVRASSVVADLWYPSKTVLAKCKTNKELKKQYKKRRLFGLPVSFLSPFMWTKLSQKLAIYHKETGKVVIPADSTYLRETFDKSMFEDLIEVDFEGNKYYAPKEYDKYLKNIYNDYMQIPPLEKRARHIALEISFPE